MGKLTKNLSEDGCSLLDEVDPKMAILTFLLDLNARKRQYNLRIAETLAQLMNLDSWFVAATADKSLHAAIDAIMSLAKVPKRATTCSDASDQARPAGEVDDEERTKTDLDSQGVLGTIY